MPTKEQGKKQIPDPGARKKSRNIFGAIFFRNSTKDCMEDLHAPGIRQKAFAFI